MMVNFSPKGLACSAETVCMQKFYTSLGITLACSQFSAGRDSDFPEPLLCPCYLPQPAFIQGSHSQPRQFHFANFSLIDPGLLSVGLGCL